jgi:ABC-2 type transport system ATP-binding protein
MIEARELTKRFGQVVAVTGLSFSVRPGEVAGFLRRNGAGKTNIGL